MKIRTVNCPCRPDTSAPVNPCYSRVYDQLVEGKYEFTGYWTGWKIRGDGKLCGPGGVKFSAAHLAMLWKLRREVLEALIADALNGPTVLDHLANRWHAGNNAANDDGTSLTGRDCQAAFPGF